MVLPVLVHKDGGDESSINDDERCKTFVLVLLPNVDGAASRRRMHQAE